MKVGLFTSRPALGFFNTLIAQLEKGKVPFEVGESPMFTWEGRAHWYRDFLSRNTGQVCLVDGWDTTFWGTRDELEKKIDAPLIFPAERVCWPAPAKPEDFPECDTPWRFINGGGVAGDAQELLRFLPFNQTTAAEDQYYSIKTFLSGVGVRDSRCRLWHNLMGGVPEELIAHKDRWRNTITGEMPCFIHGSGGSHKTRPDIFPAPLPYPGFVDTPGMMSLDELHWLYNSALGMRSVVELGSFMGRSTHALLCGCPGPVYSVDPRDPDFIAVLQGDPKQAPEIRRAFWENLKEFQNLKILEILSVQAARIFPEKAVDMVFIDGDHNYEPFKADIAAWLPKTTKLICGHDYSDAFPTVKRAVMEAFGNNFGVHGTIWYAKRG